MHIGLVGDRRDEVRAHTAIPRALALAAGASGVEATFTWVPSDAAMQLDCFDAVWLVPGSPYASMEGALAAAHHARSRDVPFLGTCGGFQHALIEYARSVLGLTAADHAESNPTTELAFIAPLSCSLVGASGLVRLCAGTRLQTFYDRDVVHESYFCSYGVAPAFERTLDEGPMRIAAVDEAGRIRAVEIPAHRFFVATLFQPELSAFTGEPHPLITAFLRSCEEANRRADHR